MIDDDQCVCAIEILQAGWFEIACGEIHYH